MTVEPGQRAAMRDTTRPGDLGWIIARHGELYAAEHGWNDEFEVLVAQIATAFFAEHDPEREHCWFAELDGRTVGCIVLVRSTDQVAKLRLLLVEPEARGHGIGRMLVRSCVAFARQAGYQTVTLWTTSNLTAARTPDSASSPRSRTTPSGTT